MLFVTALKRELSLLPVAPTAVAIATPINAAIKAYSIAVTPSSSRKKLISFFILGPPFLECFVGSNMLIAVSTHQGEHSFAITFSFHGYLGGKRKAKPMPY